MTAVTVCMTADRLYNNSSPVVVLQGVVIDHVDHRAHHVGLVPPDPVQQRLQPALRALTVAVEVIRSDQMRPDKIRCLPVEVGDDGRLDVLGAEQPRPDQADSLRGADHLHLGILLDVLVQVVLDVVHRARVIHQDDFVKKMRRRPVED